MNLKSLILTVLAFGTGVAALPGADAPTAETRRAPLFSKLGNLQHPVTTKSPLAQRYFNQGLTLLYAFNHAEAIRSFEAAAHLDPSCAMAWWGVAYAHGPNINAPMTEAAVPKAWAALQQAQALSAKASPREQAYIAALAKRYQAEPTKDRAPLDLAYAEAMREVAKAYPDDLDASVLLVEALMDTMPWDYWTPAQEPKPATKEVLATLRSVLRRDPDHPGANHFYIHAVEAGPNPELALPSADRLGGYAPNAGHLVHMPSHIYIRVGEYAKALHLNEIAAQADEAYIAQCRAQGYYPGLYYPHNVHFIWFAAGFEGRSGLCLESAKKVAQYALDKGCGAVEGPRLRHLPLLAQVRFGRWDAVLAAAEPTTHDLDRAMWHYARGLAFVGKGDADGGAKSLAEFRRLAATEAVKATENPAFPATAILAVAEQVLAGKVALARGQQAEALATLEAAVTAEAKLPYMEPSFWYFPVRQSLGAALLQFNEPAKAEAVFRADLTQHPRNGWSLHGLAESLRRQDRHDAAARVQRELDLAWANADVGLDFAWY